ncbi:MAG TPA: hypothetical protein VGG69_03960 [Rhizomicrobium sp.]
MHLFLLGLLGAPQTATPGEAPPEPPPPLALPAATIDAPAGRSDEQVHLVPCSAMGFEANLHFLQVRTGSNWRPVGQLVINFVERGPNSSWTGFGVVLAPRTNDPHVILALHDGETPPGLISYATHVSIDQPIHLVLTWTEDGLISATVGNETHDVMVGQRIRTLTLFASGAKIRFDGLRYTAADVPPQNCTIAMARQPRTYLRSPVAFIQTVTGSPLSSSMKRSGVRVQPGPGFSVSTDL